jgi:hypothetical protein
MTTDTDILIRGQRGRDNVGVLAAPTLTTCSATPSARWGPAAACEDYGSCRGGRWVGRLPGRPLAERVGKIWPRPAVDQQIPSGEPFRLV